MKIKKNEKISIADSITMMFIMLPTLGILISYELGEYKTAIIILCLLIPFLFIARVPEGEEWIIERLGKFNRTIKPGVNLVIPFFDSVREKISTRDIILENPEQEDITKDNAVIVTNTVAFIRVTNPYDAVYGIEDFKLAIQKLIMTTLRSILGDINLDEALSKREFIKNKLKEEIIDDIINWGVTIKSVEIQDIRPNSSMQKVMEQQVAAERERRAIETLAAGKKQAAILEAEGKKKAAILEAQGKLEATKYETEAKILQADASAKAIEKINEKIQDKEMPAMFLLGDKYITSFEKLSQSPNSKFVIYPADLQNAIKGLLSDTFKK